MQIIDSPNFIPIDRSPDLNSLSSQLESGAQTKEAQEAAKQFEAIFLKNVLQSMTSTLEDGSFMGNEPGSDYYQDIFLTGIAQQMSDTGNYGIARQILNQIQQRHETDSNNTLNPLRALDSRDYYRVSDDSGDDDDGSPDISSLDGTNTGSGNIITRLGNTLRERLNALESTIQKAADTYGIHPGWIKAVIAQESYGNPRAMSSKGAGGLMQLMPGTARDLGVNNVMDPEQNIMAGTHYLRQMLDRYGSMEKALAAYNAGPGNVDRYGGVPPFNETQKYVRNVANYFQTIESR